MLFKPVPFQQVDFTLLFHRIAQLTDRHQFVDLFEIRTDSEVACGRSGQQMHELSLADQIRSRRETKTACSKGNQDIVYILIKSEPFLNEGVFHLAGLIIIISGKYVFGQTAVAFLFQLAVFPDEAIHIFRQKGAGFIALGGAHFLFKFLTGKQSRKWFVILFLFQYIQQILIVVLQIKEFNQFPVFRRELGEIFVLKV